MTEYLRLPAAGPAFVSCPLLLIILLTVVPCVSFPVMAGDDGEAPLNLRFMGGSKTDLTWDAVPGADSYGLYRGIRHAGMSVWREYFCLATEIDTEFARDTEVPDVGQLIIYVVGWMKRDPDTGDLTWHRGSDGRSTRPSSKLSCGERLYVDPWAPPGGDGKSWDSAYETVDEAMHHPHTRNRSFEVWIRNCGKVPGQVEVPGNGAFLRGGFSGSEDYPWDRDDGAANSVIVECVEQNKNNRAEAVRVERVRLEDGIYFQAEYDGAKNFTIVASDSSVAGIIVEGVMMAEAVIIVDRCELTGTIETYKEGYSVEMDVRDSHFTGAGIRAGFVPDLAQVRTRLNIRRNVFEGNGSYALKLNDTCLGSFGQDYGGVIESNIIRDRDTAMYLSCCSSSFEDSPPHLECSVDVIISHNTIVDNGDGIVCNAKAVSSLPGYESTGYCRPRVWNNVIADNTGYAFKEFSEHHGELEDTWTDPAEFVSNDLHGNGHMYLDEGTRDLDTTSEINSLEGSCQNISVDPRFVDQPGGDLHLRSDSPLVDRGGVDAPGGSRYDIDRDRRILDGDHDGYAWPDIGADEVP